MSFSFPSEAQGAAASPAYTPIPRPDNADYSPSSAAPYEDLALVCLSHLRWDFVYQRPQHLLSRFAKTRPVFFVEEPAFEYGIDPYMHLSTREDGRLTVAVPHLPEGIPPAEAEQEQGRLLAALLTSQLVGQYILWYYAPMAASFSADLSPALTVFDAMDELSAFRGAPPRLLEMEQEVFRQAGVVFTGGHSIYEKKKTQHHNVHPMPSSIDPAHFAKARYEQPDPEDQVDIPRPRLGFYGVIDERFDVDLLGQVARLRPDYQWIVLGPVIKIDPSTLPQAPNIHYLPGKSYNELPLYLSGWDAAMMPFAINEATRYISPTKTPEFLAAGRPVVSTPIVDVVSPYGHQNLVHIAEGADAFARAADMALAQRADADWLARTDTFLSQISWDQTFQKMEAEMRRVFETQ